jgi:hypothetical protein
MTNGASQSFKKRILEECKKLTDEGKHIEASHLFRTYFPDFESPLPERLDNFYV